MQTAQAQTAIAASWTATPYPPEITDAKSVSMRLVPAGEFTMGSDTDDSNLNRAHRLSLDAFYMDRYEVTNALYEDCVTAGICEPPHSTESYYRSSYLCGLDHGEDILRIMAWGAPAGGS